MKISGRNIKQTAAVALLILATACWLNAGEAGDQKDASTGRVETAGASPSLPEQENHRSYQGAGYVFFAPGVLAGDGDSTASIHFGFGGEGLLYKGIGVGGDIGFLAPPQDLGAGIGVASLNGSYHFNRDKKLSPFVTGGYSIAFRNGIANGFNFGGGVNYMMRDRIGLRFELRDMIPNDCRTCHYVGFRIGFLFR